MVESTSLPEKLRSISRNPDKALGDLAAFMASVNHYLVIKAVMSLITGLAIALYLVILGVDFAIIWGSLAFFMNFVPYIGSIIAAIPAVTLALLDAGPVIALSVAAGFVVVNIVVGNVLEPRYMGKGSRSFDSGSVSFASVLGLDIRPCRHVPLHPPDHDCQNCIGKRSEKPLDQRIAERSGPRPKYL